MSVICTPESHRESEARDNPGETDKKYFINRHKKRRETLATITDTVRNNTEVIPEESKLKGNKTILLAVLWSYFFLFFSAQASRYCEIRHYWRKHILSAI